MFNEISISDPKEWLKGRPIAMPGYNCIFTKFDDAIKAVEIQKKINQDEIDRLRHGWMMSDCTAWFISGSDDPKHDAPKCGECRHTKVGDNFCDHVVKKVQSGRTD